MSGQDKVVDVFLSDGADDEIDEVVQIFVIGFAPIANGRAGRDDDKVIFVLHVHRRKVVALPVGVGAEAVKAEKDVDLLAGPVTGRTIEKERPARLEVDRRTGLGDDGGFAIAVGTMPYGRCVAVDSKQDMRIALGGCRRNRNRPGESQRQCCKQS